MEGWLGFLAGFWIFGGVMITEARSSMVVSVKLWASPSVWDNKDVVLKWRGLGVVREFGVRVRHGLGLG